jgi:Cu+-exporting ATPase
MQGVEESRSLAPEPSADPVCGMEVAETSRHRYRLGEVEYRFCSAHCLERFSRHPEAFVGEGE